jgi:uridine phosphorylase
MTSDHFPILAKKDYDAPSVFQPENLLREARRQKGIPLGQVPLVCLLDPDGDILDYLLSQGLAEVHPAWACYHTHLYEASYEGVPFGILARAVGASFAVLLAEQLFVSGCRLLVSITSAGMVQPPPGHSRFLLIEGALRDEGTSYHYLPPDQPAQLAESLRKVLVSSFAQCPVTVEGGWSWTTDAPYRETDRAIQAARQAGIVAVEMESAALYAFAQAKGRNVVCYAHLTNTMAQAGEDFEKGPANGSLASLALLVHTARTLLSF